MVPFPVREHEAIGSHLQFQPVLEQGVVQFRPARGVLDTIETLALHPADQALDAGTVLHLDRSALRAALLGRMVVGLQSEGGLEFLAQLAERRVVVVRRVDGVAGRVNLVDGDVDVEVVRVVVRGTHTLVLAKAQAFAQALLDGPKDVRGRLLTGAERNDQVIGFVRS